jgi:hypothetical protein
VKYSALIVLALLATACREPQVSRDEHRPGNPDTPAGKVGQVTHDIAKDAGKAAKEVGKEIGKAARDARAGWKEANERDKSK